MVRQTLKKEAADRQVIAALTTERSFSYFREGNRERRAFSKSDWEGLISSGYMIAGNPDTVAHQITAQMKQIGANHFMGMFHIGSLTHERVVS